MGRPSLLPAPAFALRLMLGEMADALLLTGQKVLPARAEATGYRFHHPALNEALEAILK
jgi:NAD dependent epimerase/dehydratase family enzyme